MGNSYRHYRSVIDQSPVYELSWLNDLPDDLLREVLFRVPEKDLLVNCRRVNTHWKSFIDDYSFWIRIAHQNGVNIPCSLDLSVPELQRFVIRHNPLGRNLLKNWNAEEGLEHWRIHENGGNRFTVEAGAGAIPLETRSEIGVRLCWATSYGWCGKSQTVDLVAEGLSEGFIDRVRPLINISEWMAARNDCGCVYQMKVQLLNKKHKTVAEKSQQRSEPQWGDHDWHKISVKFQDYGRGVRYVKFLHRGKDTKFWAGHYGSKMAAPSVVVQVPEASR